MSKSEVVCNQFVYFLHIKCGNLWYKLVSIPAEELWVELAELKPMGCWCNQAQLIGQCLMPGGLLAISLFAQFSRLPSWHQCIKTTTPRTTFRILLCDARGPTVSCADIFASRWSRPPSKLH